MNKQSLSNCIYLNTYSYNQHHEIFNTLVINALQNTYGNCELYITKSSWKYISRKINYHNMIVHRLLGIDKNNSLSYLLRYYVSAIQNIRIYLKLKKQQNIFFAFENVISLWFINFLNKWLKKKIYVFCHGDLELLNNNNRGITTNILRYYAKKSFLNKKFNNIKLIVLGDVIKDNLHQIANIELKSINSIDLPFICDKQFLTTSNSTEKINLGIIGSINPARGSLLYKQILDNNLNKNIKFYIIGNLRKENNIFDEQKVTIYGKDQFLPREDFTKYVSNLDYILMLYSNDYYHLTASAAFFDAVIYKKPIIGLKNEYFNYLFKKFGPIGYLFDNLCELQDFINNLDINMKSIKFDYSKYYEKLQLDGFIKSLKSITGE